MLFTLTGATAIAEVNDYRLELRSVLSRLEPPEALVVRDVDRAEHRLEATCTTADGLLIKLVLDLSTGTYKVLTVKKGDTIIDLLGNTYEAPGSDHCASIQQPRIDALGVRLRADVLLHLVQQELLS